MPLTNSLLEQLAHDHPGISYIAGDDFVWSPARQSVYFRQLGTEQDYWSLLHETAHATLGHTGYLTDVELLKKEVEAWEMARLTLAPKYGIIISPSHVDSQIDTYRNWIYQRSLCPMCTHTGIQIETNRYSCINCSGSWRVNDARRCSLRRYAL